LTRGEASRGAAGVVQKCEDGARSRREDRVVAAIPHPPPAPAHEDPRDFSIILGGPLYQLLRRAHCTDDALHLVRRRILAIVGLAWLPLLLLALVSGDALGDAEGVPFLKDIEVHVRFLVALPLLIAAELIVHSRLHPVANEFLVRDLVPPEQVERFRTCIDDAMRLRNSVWAEIAMLAFVYVVGVPVIWRALTALGVSTWYAHASAQGTSLTLPGTWYAYVALPMFQFLLLRWLFRIVVWIVFLWRVSRIPLRVTPIHGDRMGGLGFLTGTIYAFVPLAMAVGALLAGTIADRIFFTGAKLTDSASYIAIAAGIFAFIVIAPLVVFAPRVQAAKRKGAREYGRLSQRYATEFEHRWLPDGMPAADSPLGSGDIQSLADLANAYEVLKATRPVPITRDAVMTLVVAILLPISPLLLTMIPAEELAKQLLKLVI
jgi:hypothetical protein